MDELSIGEVAQRAGLNTSAVRYYERIGLLPAPHRKHGQRRYAVDTLKRLNLISFAQKAGFTLTEIKMLFEGFAPNTPAGDRWQTLATQKLAEVDALIRRAEQMKRLIEMGMACVCVRWEDCQIINGQQYNPHE
ncbi:MAG: MerR family transcriptional regulator [Anaerolineae bacterium]|nr:MerR family transcriptional regulator [Anaerolineae bacterium]